MGVGDIGLRGSKTAVLGIDDVGMQPSADAKTTLASCVGFREGAIRIAHAAGDVGCERSCPSFDIQSAGGQFDFALSIDKLVEADEHLDAQVPGHVVTGSAAEIANSLAGRGDLIGVGHTDGSLDVGADFDRTRSYAPFGLQTSDDFVHAPDLMPVFRLGIVDEEHTGPDGCVEVGFHEIVIDAAHRVGSALVDHRDAAADQVAGDTFQIRRNGVFQVHVDKIATAMPGIADEPVGDNGHGQAGSLQTPSGISHRTTSVGIGLAGATGSPGRLVG